MFVIVTKNLFNLAFLFLAFFVRSFLCQSGGSQLYERTLVTSVSLVFTLTAPVVANKENNKTDMFDW